MKQKKNGFFITILLLLISLAFIVTVSVVFNNIKTNLEREIISSLSEEAEENAALIEKRLMQNLVYCKVLQMNYRQQVMRLKRFAI